MENKTLTIALISVFYIFGLCAFYTQTKIFPAILITIALILCCIFEKLKPMFCVFLCLLFFGGFFNAKLKTKEYDSLSLINSINNAAMKGRVYSIPKINKEKKIAKFYMGIYEANIKNKAFIPENTKIFVSIFDEKERYDDIKIGDVIEIKGNLRKPKEARNPSEFDYRNYLKNKDVFVILYSNTKPESKNFKIINKPDIKNSKNKVKELWWLALGELDKTRTEIISRHEKYIKSPNLEVFGGVVFGDDAINPPDDVKQSFINSGLLHLLAASGLNVALIFGIWWWIASFLNMSYRIKILSGMAIVVLYTFITGFPPSILRAAIMLTLILAGRLMFKEANNLALIFFTGFIMLLFDPKLINDVGFELSFLVTGGLITCIEPICERFKAIDKLYKKRFSKKPAIVRAALYLISPVALAGMILVPLVAQIWAAPLQGYYFNTFTPYSVFANIVVVPFIGIISFIGFLSSILSMVPILGNITIQISAFILNPLITILLNVAEYFSKLPGAIIKIPSGNPFQIIIYYSLVLCLVFCIKENFKKFKANIVLGVLATVLIVSIISIPTKNFEILVFDVGNADNFLIKTPKNKYIMIDTGKLPYKGISSAKRITLEYLYDKNIKTLEYLIVTHFDNDHSGGTIDILDNINVKNVIIQKNSCDTKNSCDILRYLKENNINAKTAQNTVIYTEKDFEIKTFSPKINTKNIDKDKFENETSTVVLIKNKEDYALFMADGGIGAFNSIKKNLPKNIKFLKVGHHGAKEVLNEKMLEYLNPEYTIISTGQNRYGHPNRETLALLEKTKCKTYSTKEFGALKFVLTPDNSARMYGFSTRGKKGFNKI